MSKNPILSELYGIRSQILAEHGDDLRGFLHSQFEQLKAAGHPIAQIKQRKIRCNGAAKSGNLPEETPSSLPGER